MTATYTLKSGNKVSMFLWDYPVTCTTWRGEVEISKIRDNGLRESKCVKRKLFEDEVGVYTVWEGQKVYVNDFDFLTVDELIAQFNDPSVKYISEDVFWATFVKDTENIAFICELPVYTTIIPYIGIALTGDKYANVLCTFNECTYTKTNWSYKVTLSPENEGYLEYVVKRNFYLSDFVRSIRDGSITMVNKGVWLKAETEKRDKILFNQSIEDEKRKNLVYRTVSAIAYYFNKKSEMKDMKDMEVLF